MTALLEPRHARRYGWISFETRRSIGGSAATSTKNTLVSSNLSYWLVLLTPHYKARQSQKIIDCDAFTLWMHHRNPRNTVAIRGSTQPTRKLHIWQQSTIEITRHDDFSLPLTTCTVVITFNHSPLVSVNITHHYHSFIAYLCQRHASFILSTHPICGASRKRWHIQGSQIFGMGKCL